MSWWGADLTVKPTKEAFKPVWVDLDKLYPPGPDESPAPIPQERRDVLVLTGRVPGRLRGWCRATDGRWVGLVDFNLYDRAGHMVVPYSRAAVPAAALTPIAKQMRR